MIGTTEAGAKRNIAVLLVVALAVVLALSLVFVAAAADHDCGGDHCRVCDSIALCGHLIRGVFGALTAVFFAASAVPTLSRTHPKADRKACVSVVSRGVRLIS